MGEIQTKACVSNLGIIIAAGDQRAVELAKRWHNAGLPVYIGDYSEEAVASYSPGCFVLACKGKTEIKAAYDAAYVSTEPMLAFEGVIYERDELLEVLRNARSGSAEAALSASLTAELL